MMLNRSEAAMLAKLLTRLYCHLWLWPILARYDAPRTTRRPPPPLQRRQWAAVGVFGRRLVGIRLELELAPVLR
jgi:hypothetical protein